MPLHVTLGDLPPEDEDQERGCVQPCIWWWWRVDAVDVLLVLSGVCRVGERDICASDRMEQDPHYAHNSSRNERLESRDNVENRCGDVGRCSESWR